AIHKRLATGALKGTRKENKFGVEEWWVYPNKEIRSALERAGRIDILESTTNHAGVASEAEIDDVEPVEISGTPEDLDALDEQQQTDPAFRQNMAGQLAEDLWSKLIAKFLGKIEEKDQLIGEMRTELAEKDRQLKLLPDIEKRAQEDRKSAELKELETIALRKQIEAMHQAEVDAKAAQERLREVEQRLVEVEKERDREQSGAQERLKELSEKLEASRKPWWKKIFGTASDGKQT
ncbi:MAG: hypothetical protein ACRD3W_07060, partial [Terriglobales bacterium]